MAKATKSAAKSPKKKATRKKATKKAAVKKAEASVAPSAPTGEPVITAKAPPKPRRSRATKAADPAKIAAGQQAGIPTQFGAEDGQAGVPAPAVRLNHDQVAVRAYEIWVRKGRPYGQDDQNWREAELELLAERG